MNKLRAWIKASRLPSQSYIALPLVLGQVLAWRATGEWSWAVFALVQLFGVFDQFYIVYANDYADVETDAVNETSTIFSGGSRVLVDGTITPEALLRAAKLMAALSVGTGVALTAGWGRVWSVPLIVVGLGLLWAYSFRPLRMSYRGGGELLQMLGVGVVLPLLGYHAQAGDLSSFPWVILAFLLPLNLATGLCTALPDEPSDRATQKRTLPVMLGGGAVRAIIIGLNGAGLLVFAGLAYPAIPASAGVATLLAVPVLSILMQALSARFAKPGGSAILVFVFFGLLCNLSLVAGLILDLSST